MDCIDTNLNTPEENIAFDELLLAEAEGGSRGATLRFWEIEDYAVILGRGGSIKDDVFANRCKKDNIQILRRASGGGTVLLGKGCLNYSLLLSFSRNSSLKNIKSSYNYILGNIISAFSKGGINLEYQPVSDLTYYGKKVSGNAQARKKNFMLHHGTFLYNFDIDKINFYLKEPKKAPPYRASRKHKEFLTNLPLSKVAIKNIIKKSYSG